MISPGYDLGKRESSYLPRVTMMKKPYLDYYLCSWFRRVVGEEIESSGEDNGRVMDEGCEEGDEENVCGGREMDR